MRIAVIGGTGAAGKHTVAALDRMGHEVVVATRSRGVDVVVDTTSLPASEAAAAEELFGRATRNLLTAEQRAQVKDNVLLSIVGVDHIRENAHYAGKRAQEHT